MNDGTVFIIDDDEGARRSVCALVESIGLKADEFPSAEKFLEKFEGGKFSLQQPTCVVLDYEMPGVNGLALQQKLRAAGCEIPVIVVSGRVDVQRAVSVMQAGAVTLLQKPYKASELEDHIRDCLESNARLLQSKEAEEEVASKLSTLDAKEKSVLQAVMEGLANKQIANRLDIGLRTVELRRANIMKKLGVRSIPEVVRMVTLHESKSNSS